LFTFKTGILLSILGGARKCETEKPYFSKKRDAAFLFYLPTHLLTGETNLSYIQEILGGPKAGKRNRSIPMFRLKHYLLPRNVQRDCIGNCALLHSGYNFNRYLLIVDMKERYCDDF
jgi:hypothetical protein